MSMYERGGLWQCEAAISAVSHGVFGVLSWAAEQETDRYEQWSINKQKLFYKSSCASSIHINEVCTSELPRRLHSKLINGRGCLGAI